jgi:hypothetical protein
MTDTEQVDERERWVRTVRLLKDEADYLRKMLHRCEAELRAHRSQKAPAKQGDADAVAEWASHCTRGRPLTEVLDITSDTPMPYVGAQPTSGYAGGAGGVP